VVDVLFVGDVGPRCGEWILDSGYFEGDHSIKFGVVFVLSADESHFDSSKQNNILYFICGR